MRKQCQLLKQLIRDPEARTLHDFNCYPQASAPTRCPDSLTITCHVVPRELLEVRGFKTLVVSIQCAHYSWPGLLKYLQ